MISRVVMRRVVDECPQRRRRRRALGLRLAPRSSLLHLLALRQRSRTICGLLHLLLLWRSRSVHHNYQRRAVAALRLHNGLQWIPRSVRSVHPRTVVVGLFLHSFHTGLDIPACKSLGSVGKPRSSEMVFKRRELERSGARRLSELVELLRLLQTAGVLRMSEVRRLRQSRHLRCPRPHRRLSRHLPCQLKAV